MTLRSRESPRKQLALPGRITRQQHTDRTEYAPLYGLQDGPVGPPVPDMDGLETDLYYCNLIQEVFGRYETAKQNKVVTIQLLCLKQPCLMDIFVRC